jgi:hypothetical protein
MSIDLYSLALGVVLALPFYGLIETIVVPRYGRWLRVQHDRRR